MRALLSAIASGREEIERIGRRHGWSVGVREEIEKAGCRPWSVSRYRGAATSS
jgi:hypothetical protein